MISASAASGAPSPTTSGSSAKASASLPFMPRSATTAPLRSISTKRPWFCQTANGRRSTSCTTTVPGRRRSTVACSTKASASRRRRAASTEKPRMSSPIRTPIAWSTCASGVMSRPLDRDRGHPHRHPAAELGAQRGEAGLAAHQVRQMQAAGGQPDEHHRDQHRPRQPALPPGEDAEPRGPVDQPGRRDRLHPRHAACSTIQPHSSGKPMPQCAACSGSSEVGVSPGWVLTSSSTSRPGWSRPCAVSS